MEEKNVVLVTGAAQGIGSEIARAFACEKGSKVILADINSEAGKAYENKLRQEGFTAEFVCADVGNEESINKLIRHISHQYGQLNVIVNNAGMVVRKPLDKLSIEDWDRVLNVNLRSIFLIAQKSLSLLKASGQACIINIASTRALMSEPDTEAYSASKGGVVALTHALAASLSEHGIRVNCISPGWIENHNYEQLTEQDHKQHFSGRVGKPDDIARACLFLADHKNSFIDGQNIIIDGGMTKKMIYI